MTKKQWYVVADAKGLKLYKNCNTKADAEQLLKNLKRLFNHRINFWIDFTWRNDSETLQHGTMFKKTNNIIKECGDYENKYSFCWC